MRANHRAIVRRRLPQAVRGTEFEGVHRPGLLAVVSLSSFAGYVIGGLVDARKTEMRDIYRARPRATVGPLLSRGGAGPALSIAW